MQDIKTKEEAINELIKDGVDTNQISDGYHSFGELYEHRVQLFIALCSTLKTLSNDWDVPIPIWRSKKHHDGTGYPSWFILGIEEEKGQQITYHLPLYKWDETNFAQTLEFAPEWDGHTPKDVLGRLKKL